MNFRLFPILLFLSLVSFAEPSLRTWTSAQGTTVEASFERIDGNQVTLKRSSGKEITLPMSSLAEKDQAFILELQREDAGSEIEGIAAQPGKTSGAIQCAGSKWSYHVYLPKSFHLARKWPVCFIMSAGGGQGGKPIKRYIPAAEQFGCILICSVESKNGFGQSEAAVKAMAEDVYERFPVEEKFALSTGMSGGSRMAYLLSEIDQNVVGVLPCGSGHQVYPDQGGARDAKLRSDTYVYSLIGTNDYNRTGAYKSHQEFDEDCRLRFFPGKHEWAPAPLIVQAMGRILGQLVMENDDLESYQADYLMSLEKLVLKLEEKTPWESHYLASFGAEVNNSAIAKRLGEKAKALENDGRVISATKAEADIEALCEAFYVKYTYFSGDTKELPKRAKMGSELAAKYPDLPHGQLLKLLGAKSPGPKKR